MRVIAFAVLFSILMVSSAFSYSGNDWLSDCDKESGVDGGFCLGYSRTDDILHLFNDEDISVSFKTIKGETVNQGAKT